MMGPHRVGVARPLYWPHGPALDGVRVVAIATGRNHMAAIGIAGEGLPSAMVHWGLRDAPPGGGTAAAGDMGPAGSAEPPAAG